MAKNIETSLVRRVLMQSIMWLILAGTIGLAALVDVRKTHAAAATLGGPQRIENFSLRLPVGWESDVNEGSEINALLVLREPIDDITARTIDVQIDRPSLTGLFRSFGRASHGSTRRVSTQSVLFGDQAATLEVTRQKVEQFAGEPYDIEQITVSRPIDAGRTLRLTLSHIGVQTSAEQQQDVELMKTVAATLVTNLK